MTVPNADPGTATSGGKAWLSRYNGPANLADTSCALAVAPDRTKLFVTGSSAGAGSGADYATVAYSGSTGAKLWASRYNGPGNGDDRQCYHSARTVAVSSDGTKVFVTGGSFGGSATKDDFATVAYNASTGAKLWAKRYNGPANGNDRGVALTVIPDGTKVFVTGASGGSSTGFDYATVAYNAANGSQVWASRYNGPINDRDSGQALAVTPDGKRLLVTGRSRSVAGPAGDDYATIAYNTQTGGRQWVQRYNGPAKDYDQAWGLGLNGDGTRVFVTGSSGQGGGGPSDFATIAYNAATGAMVWTKRYGTTADDGAGFGSSLVFSGQTGRVYVTGYADGPITYRYATVAYNATTGGKLWDRKYGAVNGQATATSVALSPDEAKLFVTGRNCGTQLGSCNFTTLAYNAATGVQQWATTYDGPAQTDDLGYGIGTGNARVFVTGESKATSSDSDFATVAYLP